MKKKTPNTEHPIIHWNAHARVSEDAPEYGSARKTDSTPNAQRPTPNAQRKRPRFDLEERLLEFSARIIRLVDALPNARAANHVAGQLLRCGTSPYSNHGEVEAAESRKDFIHKLKICLKELKETKRWLRLIEKSEMLSEKSIIPILVETGSASSSPASEQQSKTQNDFAVLLIGRWALSVGRSSLLRSVFDVRCFR